MHETSLSHEYGRFGCTQVTEILYTPNVHLVANLPKEFELATVYVAAVCATAGNVAAANCLIKLLTVRDTAQQRMAAGFE
jgi:molybdate transport system substrate-binding protein